MSEKSPGLYRRQKRLLDIVVSIFLLVLTFPIQAVVALCILSKMGRPVLFKQERPGLNAKVFVLLKFRTMSHSDESTGVTSDSERLTSLGALLRASSLDELPTLVNVIRGDMSLVGPRPLLVSYLARYSSEQARRHEVRPGVTGLAQVNGRNAISWEEKFNLDIEYVNRASLKLDFLILCKTIKTVLQREGISARGQATMPEYRQPREG